MSKDSAFTVIEVIAIIVLIAVLSAVAISRIGTTRSISVLTEADVLKTHLRYVHLRALSDDAPWGISFAGNSYTVMRDGNVAPYNLPNENSPTRTMPSGITISGNDVNFDEWGNPGTDADMAITINPGGKTITITRNTGFIP